jgi:diadenosine tetraphosphate (Ap4A) HIT family hydrolase
MTEYLDRLPIGERVSTAHLTGNELWPFDTDLETRPLDPPLIPEPARQGLDGVDCISCETRRDLDVWRDDRWLVRIPAEPSGLPIVAVLISRAHHDLETLPHELATELGPMIQRVARAVGRLEDVGRVHVNRWGDGSEHFHVWLLPRPKGMWQLRGALLAAWDDLLPKVPADEWAGNRLAVVAALVAEGGQALIELSRPRAGAGPTTPRTRGPSRKP